MDMQFGWETWFLANITDNQAGHNLIFRGKILEQENLSRQGSHHWKVEGSNMLIGKNVLLSEITKSVSVQLEPI